MGSRGANLKLDQPEPETTVYIGNLPNDSIQGDVEHIFSSCKIRSIRMVRDRETDAFRGFAYVEFEDSGSVRRALELNGAMYDGRQLKIDIAQSKRGRNIGFRGGSGTGGRNNRGASGFGNDFDRSGTPPSYNHQYEQQQQPPHHNRGSSGYGGYNRQRQGSSGSSGGGFNRQTSSPDYAISPPTPPSAARPKLKLLPRTVSDPPNAAAERNVSIFGSGRPRPPSPPSKV